MVVNLNCFTLYFARSSRQREPGNLVLRYFVPIKTPVKCFAYSGDVTFWKGGAQRHALPRYQSDEMKIFHFHEWESNK